MIRNCDLLDTPCADLVERMTGREVSGSEPAQRFVDNWLRNARDAKDGWDVTIVHRPGDPGGRLRVAAEGMFGRYCELNRKFGRGKAADVDFAGWLMKRADFALWVPEGTPVQLANGSFAGVVAGVADDFADDAYTVVSVDTDRGTAGWKAWQLARADIPQSILDYAKHLALRDFKCPLAKGGE